jgi:hypothetical protein
VGALRWTDGAGNGELKGVLDVGIGFAEEATGWITLKCASIGGTGMIDRVQTTPGQDRNRTGQGQ